MNISFEIVNVNFRERTTGLTVHAFSLLKGACLPLDIQDTTIKYRYEDQECRRNLYWYVLTLNLPLKKLLIVLVQVRVLELHLVGRGVDLVGVVLYKSLEYFNKALALVEKRRNLMNVQHGENATWIDIPLLEPRHISCDTRKLGTFFVFAAAVVMGPWILVYIPVRESGSLYRSVRRAVSRVNMLHGSWSREDKYIKEVQVRPQV